MFGKYRGTSVSPVLRDVPCVVAGLQTRRVSCCVLVSVAPCSLSLLLSVSVLSLVLLSLELDEVVFTGSLLMFHSCGYVYLLKHVVHCVFLSVLLRVVSSPMRSIWFS